MNELFPDWRERGAPLNTPVTEDDVYYLVNDTNGIKVPSWLVPNATHNHGNYALSLGNLCRWLAEQAEGLGVNLFPGFAGSEILYNDDGSVRGVATGDMGVAANGEHKPTYQQGYELLGKYTIFAEGCRGNLGKQLIKKFDLADESATQHYAIGLKELWDLDPEKHVPGKVIHAMGWPCNHLPGGFSGGFLYHLENTQAVVGLIVDLGYKNPHLSPFDEFQRFKHHPQIAKFLIGGKRVSYGARAIIKGGLPALPKLVVPGGLLIGDDAGFLNMLKIKGSHTAMKSGMLAADAVFNALASGATGGTVLDSYPEMFKNSWLYNELYEARNAGPAIHKFGTLFGSAFTWIDQTFLRGHAPFTISDDTPDYATLKKASEAKPSTIRSPTTCFRSTSCRRCSYRTPIMKKTSRVIWCSRTRRYRSRKTCRSTTSRRSVTAPPGFTKWSKKAVSRASRSTRRTACTARRATSRIRRRTSTGWFPREPADRTTRTCSQPVSSSKKTPLLHTPALPEGPGTVISASR